MRHRRQQFAYLQRRVEPVGPHDRQPPHPGHLARHLLPDEPGGGLVQQNRGPQQFGHPSSREARFTTGPKTVTFTWSTVPILPATAGPVATPMPA